MLKHETNAEKKIKAHRHVSLARGHKPYPRGWTSSLLFPVSKVTHQSCVIKIAPVENNIFTTKTPGKVLTKLLERPAI